MPRKGEEFVHLHNHTEFSLLDGASRIPDLLKRAEDLGMPAIAITDHGVMYGAVNFYATAQDYDVKPIIGCEVYVAPRSRLDKETREDRSPYHLTLLAKDKLGYRNLIKLVTISHLEGFYSRPRIDREVLEKHAKGLVALSGCQGGEIPRHFLEEKGDLAKSAAEFYKGIFGDDFYLEIMDHGLKEQKQLLPEIIALSKTMKIPLVATNDTHYINREDASAQDTMMCIQMGANLTDKNRLKFETDQLYVKSRQEMLELFKDNKDALDATLEIAEKCDLKLELGKIRLPKFDVPKGETPNSYLERLAWDGIKIRYGVKKPDEKRGGEHFFIPPEVNDRVKYELSMIEKMGYAPYFLIVQDFINYSRSKGIQVGPGRGSAAGSIVSYALGITGVDPLKYGLIFERFLNPERISMPDIDIDFCYERRSEVIDYVTQKYGADHVAQIVTFGTMGARAAIRDVGRVMGVALLDVDKVAKMVPFGPDASIDSALATQKDFKAIYDKDPKIKALIDMAKKLEGLSRHASVHAAGVVISEEALTEYVPLQRVSDAQLVTQYPMEDLERLGLLKMDFLGLRNLTMMAYAVELIRKTQGINLDLYSLPFNDAKTYQLLCSGDTAGIFQLESGGMRGIIKELKPTAFEEIIALLALYRPGPIESGMVSDFTKRKHGEIDIRYDLPELEPILRETFGVILYQEQVMEIASKVAGFTLGQADILRRAMGKKKAKEMHEQKELFINGAVSRGISNHKAADLFNLCAKFAGYGFNKSHSTAYGVISYLTAYLKANFPAEFMAALLTSITGDSDKVSVYINELRRMGIKILAPDINESQRDFTVVADGIRFGLVAVKNIGEGAVQSIINSRKEGPYRSLADFYSRVDQRTVNKRVIESLIKAGAFDSLKMTRAFLLSILEKTLDTVASDLKERSNGQGKLFEIGSSRQERPFEQTIGQADIDEFPPDQLLKMEKEMLGLYISDHPLTHLREMLETEAAHKISEISAMREGMPVIVGGLLIGCRRITTKRGDLMMVATLEDLSGSIGVVFFPKTFEKYSGLLNDDAILLIKGKVNKDIRTDEFNVAADIIENLGATERVRTLHIKIEQPSMELLNSLKELLSLHAGSELVYLHVDGRTIAVGDNYSVKIDPSLVDHIESLVGAGSISIEFEQVSPKEAERISF